jgi:hypothetical protein
LRRAHYDDHGRTNDDIYAVANHHNCSASHDDSGTNNDHDPYTLR